VFGSRNVPCTTTKKKKIVGRMGELKIRFAYIEVIYYFTGCNFRLTIYTYLKVRIIVTIMKFN